ncbi:MAG: hypothetical protein LBU32_12925 [Clostridiales bacterium]|jgi:hypothetical protein|nr:hypothetical protein [Clostridiales bacterium]
MDKLATLRAKYAQFFSDRTPGQILATICPYTFSLDYKSFGLPDRGYDSWDYGAQMREFIEYAAKRHRVFMEFTKSLDNDYFPALNLNFGYGVNSAYFTGQPVKMGVETSWTDPYLSDWSMLERLAVDEGAYWVGKIMEGYQILKEICDGSFAISSMANAGPGDMANAVRGNDLFTDIYDEPELVRELMDKCADAAIWLEEKLQRFTRCDAAGDGSVTANVWFPGNAPYISEDFNDLCSRQSYEEFGRVYTQKIISHFEGGYIHHHAKGRHIHPAVAMIDGLKLLEISLDPKCPRPVDDLPRLFEEHDGLPLMIRCHAKDLPERIGDLKLGRVVIMLNIDTLDEGREAMKLIRKNSII